VSDDPRKVLLASAIHALICDSIGSLQTSFFSSFIAAIFD
jgi:hypothetical protein